MRFKLPLGAIVLTLLASCAGVDSTPATAFQVPEIEMTTAQLEHGAKIFKYKCAACHSMDVDKSQFFGPHLNQIMGRKIGELESYKFSDDVADFDFYWTLENMDAWLENPQQIVPNMCMPFLGIKNSEQRLALIGYMQQASTP
ncbi:c-type cytochrome [Pseudidiomarina salilacus]|uniref:c-type cytochrome n=1 Tax=Pseudidiomarina salilacus TaxID=3384452 RepID=UPI003984EADD